MKRHTLFIYVAALLTMLGTVLPLSAQKKQTQDALYIYRNDGGFLGFFYDDIDRFEYSRIDTIGVLHDDFVVQEIYALDTLFRIPLDAIDSIAFVTPETVYKADVAHTFDSDMWKYVIKQDSMTLILASNTPSGLIPKVGDKLANEEMSEIMPVGFIGKVKNVSNGSDGIIVECNEVSLLDVFDRFVSKGRIEMSPTGDVRRRAPKHYDMPDVTGTLTLSNEFTVIPNLVSLGASGTASYTLKNKYDIEAFVQVGLITGLQFAFIYRGEHGLNFDISLGASVNVSYDKPLYKDMVPVGPLIFTSREMGITIGGSGGVFIQTGWEYAFRTYGLIQFNSQREGEQQQIGSITTTKPLTRKDFKLAGTATVNVGLYSKINITPFCEDIAEAYARLEAGWRGEVSADIKADDLLLLTSDTKVYDLLNRDGSIASKWYGNFQLSGSVGPWTTKVTFEPIAFVTPWEGGLVPDFKNPLLTIDAIGNKVNAMTYLSRNTLFNQPVGFSIYNQETGKHLKTQWFGSSYDGVTAGSDFSDYDVDFSEMYGGLNTRIYPAVKLFNLFEIVGKPYLDYEIEPEIIAVPSPLTFIAEGGSENLAISANMPIKDVKLSKNVGKDGKAWASCKLAEELAETTKIYSIDVKENTEPAEREAIVTIECTRGDGKIETKEISITQEANLESVLKLSDHFFYVPGYSLAFSEGYLTTSVTATYTDGASLKLESSDNQWLEVSEDGSATAINDKQLRQKYSIRVKPNPSFKTTRDGIITAELILPNGDKGHAKIYVQQTPLLKDIKFIPGTVVLMAEEFDGAAVSDIGEVFIDYLLLDDGFKPYISKQEVKPREEDDWIDQAKLDGRYIRVRAKAYSNEEESRTGGVIYRITLTSGESFEATLPVQQREKGAFDLFTINPKHPAFPPEGGDITCSIVGENVDLVSTPASIFIHNGTGFGGVCRSDIVTLHAEPTAIPEERHWQFTLEVQMKDGTKVQKDFVAYQKPLGTLTLSPTEVIASTRGGLYDVDIDLRGEYSYLRISSSANWCKAALMQWRQAELDIEENPVSEERRATVTIEFVDDNGAVLRTATVQVIQRASDESTTVPTVEEDQLLFNSWKHSDDTNSGYYLWVKFGTDGTYLEKYFTPDKVTTYADGVFTVKQCVRDTKPEYYSVGREWMFAVLKNYDYFIRYTVSRNYKNSSGKTYSDEKYAWVTPDGRYLVFCDEIYNAEEGDQATTYTISKRYLTFTAEGGSEIVELKNYGKGTLGVRMNDADKEWLNAEVVDGGMRITTLKNKKFYTWPGPHYHNALVTIFCTDENGKEYITENVLVNQADNLCEHLQIVGAEVDVYIPIHYKRRELKGTVVWDGDILHDYRKYEWVDDITYISGDLYHNFVIDGKHIQLSFENKKGEHYNVSFDIDNFSDDINVGLRNSRAISNLRIESVKIDAWDNVWTYSINASNIRLDDYNHYDDHTDRHYYANKDTGLSYSYVSIKCNNRNDYKDFHIEKDDFGYISIDLKTLPIP